MRTNSPAQHSAEAQNDSNRVRGEGVELGIRNEELGIRGEGVELGIRNEELEIRVRIRTMGRKPRTRLSSFSPTVVWA